MRKHQIYPVLLTIIIIFSIGFHNYPTGRATPNYSPGVKVGDTITYGIIAFSNSAFAGPNPFVNLTSIEDKITSVDLQSNTVSATLVYTYKDGTHSNYFISGTTDTGTGQLFPYILAGGLSAGNSIFKPPTFYYNSLLINETVNRNYAGAVRPVNLINDSYAYNGGFKNNLIFTFDQATGFLVEVSLNETAPYNPPVTYILHFKVTSTNVWTPQTGKDFTFDATPLPTGTIYQGAGGSFRLDIGSVNNFTGTISLTDSLLSPNATRSPTISLASSSVSISSQTQSASAILDISTNSSTRLGDYIVSVNATSGSTLHQDLLNVIVVPPDFEITANPANLTISQGGSETTTITIGAEGSFKGTVSLLTFSSNIIASTLSKTTVVLNSTTTSGTSTLTVKVANTTLPTLTSANVQAQSGNLIHDLYIPLNVTGPDFSFIANPTFASFKQGSSGSTTLQLRSRDGFSGNVTLSTEYGFNPLILSYSKTIVKLTAGGNANVTLTATAGPAISPGYFNGVVLASAANGLTHYASITFQLVGPDFTFQSSVFSMALKAGQTMNATLTLSRVQNFNGTIQLSTFTFNGEPVLQSTLSRQQVTLNSTTTTANVTLTVAVPLGTSPSYSSVQVTATSGNLSHTVYINIQIIGPDFTISATPNFLTILAGGSAQSVISLSSILGFSANITLSASSLPLLPTFSTNTVSLKPNATATSTLTIQVPKNTVPGYYNVQVSATAGSVTKSSSVSVQVTGPDFSFISSSYFIQLKAGQSTNATLTLSRLQNFNGTIGLSIFANGGAAQTSLSSTQVQLNSTSTSANVTLSISVPLGASPAYESIEVSATSGSLVHYVYFDLQIIGPDFTISPSTYSLSISAGSSGQATLTLSSILGLTANITLTTLYSSFPTSFTPNRVLLNANATATSTVTIQVPKGTLPGGYYVNIQASTGTITHQTSIFVSVAGPDFSISYSLTSSSINEGGNVNATITVQSIDNFSGNVSLTGFSQGGTLSSSPLTTVVKLAANSSTTTKFEIFANNANPGGYQFEIIGNGGNITHTAYIFISVVGPDFSLSLNVYQLAIVAGQSATSTVTLTSLDSFTGNITLTTQSFYSGITGTFAKNPISVASGSSATTTLTVKVLSTFSAGYYQITINATSGHIVHLLFLNVQVVAPDFSLQITPSQITLKAGHSATATITFTSLNGFNGTVTLLRPFYTGVTISFSQQNVTLVSGGTTNVSMNITVSAADSGESFYIFVYAESGNLFRYGSFFLTVTGPSFSFGNIPSLNIEQGSTGAEMITVNSLNGFSGNVSLIIQNYYGSFSSSLNPSTVNLTTASTASSNMTIAVASSQYPGSYYFQLTGTSGNITRTTYFFVQVTPAPYTISANPNILSLSRGTSINSTITINDTTFTGQISLSTTTQPSGLTVTLTPQTLSLKGNFTTARATLTISVPSTAATGNYNITVTATSNGHSQSTTIELNVATPDFSLSPQQQTVTITQGTSTTDTITAMSIGGFSGSVQLSESFLLTTSLTGSLNPSTLILKPSQTNSTILTISASSDATAGFGDVRINATSTATGIVHTLFIYVYILPAPDFQITASQQSLSLVAGSSQQTGIGFTSLNGYSATIQLTTNVSPAGLNASIPSSILVNGSTATLLTVRAGPKTVGNYTITITGTDGNKTHYAVVKVTVTPMPDFAILAPSAMNVVSGQSVQTLVAFSSLHNFSGSIDLVALPTSTSLASYFSTSAVNVASGGSANAMLTISAYNTPAGSYSVIIGANSGPLIHNATISLSVLPAPDFTLTASTRLSVSSGGAVSTIITITPLHGFTSSVKFSLNGLTDFSGVFNPNPLQGGSGSVDLTITAASNVPHSNYTLTIVAVGGTSTHSATLIINVNASSPVSVTSTPLSWLHKLSLSRNHGTQTWTTTVTNTGKIPIYVQLRIAGSSSAQSAIITILPKASATITATQGYSTAGKSSFTATLYYSTVESQSSIVDPRSLTIDMGSFIVGK